MHCLLSLIVGVVLLDKVMPVIDPLFKYKDAEAFNGAIIRLKLDLRERA